MEREPNEKDSPCLRFLYIQTNALFITHPTNILYVHILLTGIRIDPGWKCIIYNINIVAAYF